MAASVTNACVRHGAFVRRTPSRRPFVVVAFRDAHRAKRLQDTAVEFARAWGQGHLMGPTEAVMHDLNELCDTDVRVRSTHPLGCASFVGLDGMSAKLRRNQQAIQTIQPQAYSEKSVEPMEAEVMLSAANDASDTAFALLKLPVGNTGAGSESLSASYLILKMEILLDDGACKVINVLERGQLSGALDAVAQQEQVNRVQSTTHCTAAQFPDGLIKHWPKHGGGLFKPGHRLPEPDMVEHVERELTSWHRARCTGTDVPRLMEEAGCDEEFQLIDGYGCLPLLCDTSSSMKEIWLKRTRGGRRVGGSAKETAAGAGAAVASGAYDAPCVQSLTNMREVLEATKLVYDVDCGLVDHAVCLDEAVAFSHWKAKQHNRITGVDWEVEGMEVDLLDPHTGGLKAVYLFRDCMDFEELQLVQAAFGSRKVSEQQARAN